MFLQTLRSSSPRRKDLIVSSPSLRLLSFTAQLHIFFITFLYHPLISTQSICSFASENGPRSLSFASRRLNAWFALLSLPATPQGSENSIRDCTRVEEGYKSWFFRVKLNRFPTCGVRHLACLADAPVLSHVLVLFTLWGFIDSNFYKWRKNHLIEKHTYEKFKRTLKFPKTCP